MTSEVQPLQGTAASIERGGLSKELVKEFLACGVPEFRRVLQGQIAKQLRGRKFKNFKEFREEFWKLVEKDVNLRSQFSDINQAAMRDGKAPAATKPFQTGKGRANITFNLDHIDALEEQFSLRQAVDLLYDLDNTQIAAPFWNQAR